MNNHVINEIIEEKADEITANDLANGEIGTEWAETAPLADIASDGEVALTDTVQEAEAPITEEAHIHIDFSSLNFNNPDEVAGINTDEISCEACLQAYESHFGKENGSSENDLLAGVDFTPSNFASNLSYMGTGMVGIFIVIALIMGVTTILNRVFSGKKMDEDKQ